MALANQLRFAAVGRMRRAPVLGRGAPRLRLRTRQLLRGGRGAKAEPDDELSQELSVFLVEVDTIGRGKRAIP